MVGLRSSLRHGICLYKGDSTASGGIAYTDNVNRNPKVGATLTRTSFALQRVWLPALLLAVVEALFALRSLAQVGPPPQMGPEGGSQSNGSGPMASPSQSNEMPPPIGNLHIPQPVHGSMIVTPPYGYAPLRVGFFVLATDPEGLGFLTYSWNFGDGSVSSLPPELYIFHTYQKPGTYVCELTTTTVDGRKNSFFQGVIVQPATH
jgi:PKD domain